ncbi:MAG: hypothetical protein JNL81_10815 [Hyphomonadaceae bacterium]|nr:hypothetical protein [Hyphomonadaceae bacterium]
MDERALKRQAREVWAELRRERRARAKLLGAADLVQSAERVTGIATKLRALAETAAALETSAPANDEAPKKAKPKKRAAKKAAKGSGAAKKSRKKKKA